MEEKGRTIKCELIGGGSLRHLNTFLKLFFFFLLAVHYANSIHAMHFVACTIVHHVVQNIGTYHTLLLSLPAPI